jgi:hypothetical protein
MCSSGRCVLTGVLADCGGMGDACCTVAGGGAGNDICTAPNFACAATDVCIACGAMNQACCGSGVNLACNTGFVCQAITLTCVAP